METTTQPIKIECQFCDFKGSAAEGARHRQETQHLIRIFKNDVAPAPQETPAQHSPLPWKWLPDEGQFIVDAKGNIVAEVPCQGCNPADGGLIVKCVNRDPAFQKLTETINEVADALRRETNAFKTECGQNIPLPTMIGIRQAENKLREALRLAREGEE